MFNFENVISGGAIGISLTGMAIVFSGLILISITINYMPVFLDFLIRISPEGKKALASRKQEEQKAAEAFQEEEDKNLASVIGLVMQMEQANLQSAEKQEDMDIVNVIGMVLQLEQEQQFALPN